jgi:hypothetical protein
VLAKAGALPLEPRLWPFLGALVSHLNTEGVYQGGLWRSLPFWVWKVQGLLLCYLLWCLCSSATTPSMKWMHSAMYLFIGGTGVWIKSLELAKQVLCCVSHTSSPFCFDYFGDRVSMSYLPTVASNCLFIFFKVWFTSPSSLRPYFKLVVISGPLLSFHGIFSMPFLLHISLPIL